MGCILLTDLNILKTHPRLVSLLMLCVIALCSGEQVINVCCMTGYTQIRMAPNGPICSQPVPEYKACCSMCRRVPEHERLPCQHQTVKVCLLSLATSFLLPFPQKCTLPSAHPKNRLLSPKFCSYPNPSGQLSRPMSHYYCLLAVLMGH